MNQLRYSNSIKKVLIVDDSEFFLVGLTEALEHAGFHAFSAKSWVDISERLRNMVPDLILMDVVIPSLDGSHICKLLKKNKKTKDIPILLFSAQRKEELEEIAKASGADGTITKSTDFTSIVIEILSFIRLRERKP